MAVLSLSVKHVLTPCAVVLRCAVCSSRYYTNWCTGTTLKDSLVNALWKFEDLHLYKHALMTLDAADWATFNVNQSE